VHQGSLAGAMGRGVQGHVAPGCFTCSHISPTCLDMTIPLQVLGLRSVVTAPARLESTCLVGGLMD
jgi:hypothetical protein